MAVELTIENKYLLESGDKLVIDFMASWCGPCKILKPMFDGVSDEVTSATFIKIDVDEHPEIAAKFEVQGVPTVLVVDSGQVIVRETGIPKINQLLQKLREGSL